MGVFIKKKKKSHKVTLTLYPKLKPYDDLTHYFKSNVDFCPKHFPKCFFLKIFRQSITFFLLRIYILVLFIEIRLFLV